MRFVNLKIHCLFVWIRIVEVNKPSLRLQRQGLMSYSPVKKAISKFLTFLHHETLYAKISDRTTVPATTPKIFRRNLHHGMYPGINTLKYSIREGNQSFCFKLMILKTKKIWSRPNALTPVSFSERFNYWKIVPSVVVVICYYKIISNRGIYIVV